MNFLSIDCSTDLGSLFIKVENKTFNKILQRDKYSNDLLMKQILDFFAENNLNFSDISEILVNQGPGNFSALRSSLATAKGIGLAKNLKLFGYGYSWGGFESLALYQDVREQGNRKFLNLKKDEHLVRLHIGLEDPKDLIKDLKRSLSFIK